MAVIGISKVKAQISLALPELTAATVASQLNDQSFIALLWASIAELNYRRFYTSFNGEDWDWFVGSMSALNQTMNRKVEIGSIDENSLSFLPAIYERGLTRFGDNAAAFSDFLNKNGIQPDSPSAEEILSHIRYYEILSTLVGTSANSPSGSKCYFWPIC